MKRFLIAFSLVLGMFTVMSAKDAIANKEGSLGLGAYMGGGLKNGISAKYWIDTENAVDAVLSFASGDYEYTYFHADYLIHKYGVATVDEGEIPLYFGLGLFTEDADEIATSGVRLPVGINYLLKDAPLDVYMEIAPTVVTGDIEGFYISGGFGFRYYFEQK